MFINYLRSTVRSWLRHKTISIINLLGLVIGMTVFLIIIQYVLFERSYDTFHTNRENIFRVESRFFKNGVLTDDWSTSSGGYGSAMQREYPEIKKIARIYLKANERIVSYDDIKHRETNVYFADAGLLEMFSYKLIEGNEKTALSEPNSIIISESTARKYFGDGEAIGKTLKLGNHSAVFECAVTGVFQDVPANSHIRFDMLISWTTLSARRKGIDEYWYEHSVYTYVQVEAGADIKKIEQDFRRMAEKYKTGPAMKDHTWAIAMTPLEDIHLNVAKSNESEIKGSKSTLLILTGVAFLTLIVAWINYSNLAITRALERAKEIAVRKTAGATKGMLFAQFLTESAFVNVISLGIAVSLTWVLHPSIQMLTNVDFGFFTAFSLTVKCSLSGIFLFGVFIAGFYPALVLSSFSPVTALRGKIANQGRGKSLRQTLVVVQFTVSMILITVSIVVFSQVKFMRDQSLQPNTAQILVLKVPARTDNFDEKLGSLRNGLLSLSTVSNVTFSSSVVGKDVGMFLSNRRADIDLQENRLYEMLRTDPEFIDTYQLELLDGRNFSRDISSDEQAIIVNEEAVKLLGYKDYTDAMHKEVLLETSDEKFEIIGVAKNYHHTSLHESYAPIMFFMSPKFRWIPHSYISLKVTSGDWDQTLTDVKKQWDHLFPESSFDYFFLDEVIDQQYKGDLAFGKLVNIFCVMIIIISSLGLLGLASYDAVLRRKEIGVRKVLGASVFDVLLLMSAQTLKLILIAYAIAVPLAYVVGKNWLGNFTFHIDLEPWMMILPVIVLLPVAMMTVSSQTIKTAVTNPVDAIRSE
jgi:putative ABC transport system permease protein